MGRIACPPPGHYAGTGTRNNADRGARRSFYANTVGALGVVSAGHNWDGLAIAVHRWALKLVAARAVFILLVPGEALS